MIPLMKKTFQNEKQTKERLINFIKNADRLSMGKHCSLFEDDFSKFQGAKNTVLFNSGGSANLAILQTLKNLGVLSEGDRIGFSALTWSTNVMPIIQLGMKPIPIDCEIEYLNVTSNTLLSRIKYTDLKAIFLTNVLGFAGDLDSIKCICDERGIVVIEDNCEALGTELNGKKTGTFGEMSSFSFFVAHHMSTIEGGAVCTNDDEYAIMLKIVRANGWDRNLSNKKKQIIRKKYEIDEFRSNYTFYDLGYNLRPTEITGFIGRIQLEYLSQNIKIRELNYRNFEKYIIDNPDFININTKHLSTISNFAFPVIANNKLLFEKYKNIFEDNLIEIRPIIAGNIQEQPFYRKYVNDYYKLTETEFIDQCGFYFGNYPELNREDINIIKKSLHAV